MTFVNVFIFLFPLRDEAEINLDALPVGQYILLKLLKPRSSSSERIGLIGVKFYGFNRKAMFAQEGSHIQLPEKVLNYLT